MCELTNKNCARHCRIRLLVNQSLLFWIANLLTTWRWNKVEVISGATFTFYCSCNKEMQDNVDICILQFVHKYKLYLLSDYEIRMKWTVSFDMSAALGRYPLNEIHACFVEQWNSIPTIIWDYYSLIRDKQTHILQNLMCRNKENS